MKNLVVQGECESCRGTGLYQGFMEAKNEAVVCINCTGTGMVEVEMKPFTGRKKRRGITKIRFGSGLILDNPRKATWMTYVEFEKAIREEK